MFGWFEVKKPFNSTSLCEAAVEPKALPKTELERNMINYIKTRLKEEWTWITIRKGGLIESEVSKNKTSRNNGNNYSI